MNYIPCCKYKSGIHSRNSGKMEKHTTTFTLFSLLCSSSYPADIMERLQGESQIPTHQTCRSELPIVDSLAAIIQYYIQCSYFPNCQSPHVTHFNCRSCIFECPCFCTLFVFPDKFGCGKLCYTNLGMLSLDEYKSCHGVNICMYVFVYV